VREQLSFDKAREGSGREKDRTDKRREDGKVEGTNK
jgi:hypothetical protein